VQNASLLDRDILVELAAQPTDLGDTLAALGGGDRAPPGSPDTPSHGQSSECSPADGSSPRSDQQDASRDECAHIRLPDIDNNHRHL
jgi:hypothetical protein